MPLAFGGVFLIGACAWLAYAIRRALRQLLFFQIEEYNNSRFGAFLWNNKRRLVTEVEVYAIAGLCLAAGAVSYSTPDDGARRLAFTLLAGLWALFYVILFVVRKPRPSKKTLVLTPRATRMFVTAIVLMVVTFLLAVWVGAGAWWATTPFWASSRALAVAMIAGLLIDHGLGVWLIAANGAMYPVEEAFRRYYIRSARRIFAAHPRLKVVAVTGSYGKTSTKEIIAHILSAPYNVLKTPRSFNTLMGICKVIREELAPEHEVFVVEMGTYQKGEIDRLCRLTPPHIGVLTAVGPQHLERFRTVDRVAEAKYELMEHLPPGGVGIFNGDDPWCRRLSDRPAAFKVIRYGAEQGPARVDVRASAIQVTGQGTEFDVTANGGPAVHFTTALLGRHNVQNILAAIAVAWECGVTLEASSEAVAELEPVEHRLQRIHGAGGVLVIDDAYNSNPTGVRMALEVLSALPGGRKVMITPGMVELGAREEEEHRQMGRLAAEACDYVILVGAARTRAIAAGLAEKAYPPDRLAVVGSLKEATQRLQSVIQSGDVVLFENDLPDTYDQDVAYF
jgi:UDP-N-acetylmuramoyl-tripeptide--D-alanyl-D-alanine ligase